MSEPFTIGSGLRYAFAPFPQPAEDVLYRIHVVFESPDGRRWSAGTDLMSPTEESAIDFCDAMNVRLGLGRQEWTALAERVFSERSPGSGASGDEREPPEFL